jgi:hypothetical protein
VHNEMSYNPKAPLKIMLICLQPASQVVQVVQHSYLKPQSSRAGQRTACVKHTACNACGCILTGQSGLNHACSLYQVIGVCAHFL